MMKNKSRCYIDKGAISNIVLVMEMETAPLTHEMIKVLWKRKGNKEMWIAKNRITGEEYGKPNEDIMEIYEYIAKDLKLLNKLLKLAEEEKRDIFNTTYNGANIIQCYNKTQKRWADGFDF